MRSVTRFAARSRKTARSASKVPSRPVRANIVGVSSVVRPARSIPPLVRSAPKYANSADFGRLVQSMSSFARAGRPYSLVVFRLGDLADFNRKFGPHTGDNVLGDAAHSLSQLASHHRGAFARVGGNLFALTLPVASGKAGEIASEWRHSFSSREAVPPAGTRFLDRHAWRAPKVDMGVTPGLAEIEAVQRNALKALEAKRPDGVLGYALDLKSYLSLPPAKKRAA